MKRFLLGLALVATLALGVSAQEAPHWPDGRGWYAIVPLQISGGPHAPGVYNWAPYADQDTCFETLATEEFVEIWNEWMDWEIGEHPGQSFLFGKPQCVEVKGTGA